MRRWLLLPALLLATAARAAGPAYTLDLSSQPGAHAASPVAAAAAARCGPGGDLDAAVAVVVVGRRAGTSAWGHTGLRFLSCEDGAMRDLLVETYRFGRGTAVQLPRRHPGAGLPPPAALRRAHRGELYLRRVPDPVDGGEYARDLAANREIWEVWLDLPPDRVRALRADLEARADRQLAELVAGTPLSEGRYRALGTNCTLPVREALAWRAGRPGGRGRGVFPFAILRRLERAPATAWVLHPSAHAWRAALDAAGGRAALAAELAAGTATLPRLHPLLRRRLAPEDRFWVDHLAARLGVPRGPAPPSGVLSAAAAGR